LDTSTFNGAFFCQSGEILIEESAVAEVMDSRVSYSSHSEYSDLSKIWKRSIEKMWGDSTIHGEKNM
jgi:hypothetical protein